MMWRGTLVLVIALLAGCTKKNEEKYCTEQTCTTPDFPFCDVTGFASGEAGTCISVSCTPGEFGECRGDQEVRCNTAGTNYDLVQCERGCDSNADGCRLCDPGETACTNGMVATCNASGALISKQMCPLGCFEDQPRCRDIAPSNDLGRFLDMVPNPPDLDLSGGATINTSSGVITTTAGSMTVPSYLVQPPPNGAAIRVIVAGRVTLGDVNVDPGTQTVEGPALAIVANGEIVVEGRVNVSDPTRSTPGGVSFSNCSGGAGTMQIAGFQSIMSAFGGGGHATSGGRGGGVSFQQGVPGGAGGAVSGTETLVPLRGGCPGGAYGGGAVQLSSRTRIELRGVIDARGGLSEPPQGPGPLGGGGAGGGILLEAPIVTLGPQAKLLANGGSGASCAAYAMHSETLAPAMGAAGDGPYCAAGGNGANVGVEATAGGDSSYTTSNTVMYFWGGGGGGGLGRVRVNTRDGTYTKANTAIEAAAATSGPLATR